MPEHERSVERRRSRAIAGSGVPLRLLPSRAGPSGPRGATVSDQPFIHERALVETDAIGPRTRIWAFAHVMPGAVIGADCNICDHTYVEGEVRLGDRVTV